MSIIDTADPVYKNRKIAALRGDTRDDLDYLLCSDLRCYGIGRSAFIMAAIRNFRLMSDQARQEFISDAKDWEVELPS